MRNILIPLFVAIVFIAGWAFGGFFANPELGRVSSVLKNSRLSAESFIIEQDLLELGASCDLMDKRMSSLGSELYHLGKQLESPTAEKDLGKQNYVLLKRQYHTMQARAYVMFHKLVKDCEQPSHVVLFFYSREDKSGEQGRILDDLVAKYPLTVFAIEFGYAPDLKFLEEYYGINQTPSIVIDYENAYQGFVPSSVIEEAFE